MRVVAVASVTRVSRHNSDIVAFTERNVVGLEGVFPGDVRGGKGALSCGGSRSCKSSGQDGAEREDDLGSVHGKFVEVLRLEDIE